VPLPTGAFFVRTIGRGGRRSLFWDKQEADLG
jgi:hypothetical protein